MHTNDKVENNDDDIDMRQIPIPIYNGNIGSCRKKRSQRPQQPDPPKPPTPYEHIPRQPARKKPKKQRLKIRIHLPNVL